MICSICKEEIKTTWYGWSDGNNAEPINTGRCCDDCDQKYVYPARIKQYLDQGTDWKRVTLEVPDEN